MEAVCSGIHFNHEHIWEIWGSFLGICFLGLVSRLLNVLEVPEYRFPVGNLKQRADYDRIYVALFAAEVINFWTRMRLWVNHTPHHSDSFALYSKPGKHFEKEKPQNGTNGTGEAENICTSLLCMHGIFRGALGGWDLGNCGMIGARKFQSEMNRFTAENHFGLPVHCTQITGIHAGSWLNLMNQVNQRVFAIRRCTWRFGQSVTDSRQ